ncbi:MAG: DUF3383 domain-containing protein [Desulfovibrionaceae bacterium]
MPISASQIVQVNPRLLKPGGKDLELNGLLLSQSDTIPMGMVMPFGDPESVGQYFGLQSVEYRLASVYFLGYNNSFIKPRAFFVARRLALAAAPWLRGGPITVKVASLKAITNGTLTLTLGAHSATMTGISFAAITSYSDAAVIVQGAIRAETVGKTAWTEATVVYDSLFDAFVVSGGAVGKEQAIDYATGTVAETLLLTLAGGAVTSQGADAQTEAENMEAVVLQTTNWVTFTTTWQTTLDEVLALGAWANGKGVAYLYVYHDTDPKLLQPGNRATIAQAVKTAQFSAVAGEWGSAEYAAFVLAMGASIDFNRIQGAITTAFKSQDGLTANVETSTDAINLLAQGVNFYGNYATRNDQFVFHYPGSMFGRYSFVDTYLNAVWINNALQVALMAGLTTVQRVPYVDEGYALIRAWLQDPINRGLRNGIIDPGVTLSELQKSQINREAGLNIVPEVQQNGFYVQVLDPAPNVRIQRGSPIVNFWYTYGGSIHRLEVASTAIV